jgi:hypothetical protein
MYNDGRSPAMNSLEKIIMEEISSLPELRLMDVLGFIRYLKTEGRGAPVEIEAWFEQALKTIRTHDQELHVAEEALDAEVRARKKSNR